MRYNTVLLLAMSVFSTSGIVQGQTIYAENRTPLVQYPRVERALQSYVDPVGAWHRNRAENEYDQPMRDASPIIGKVALMSLAINSASALTPIAFVVPPAMRATRVALWGSPVDGPRRDTLIWIAAPAVLHARDRRHASR